MNGLKELRSQKGLTQQEVADAIGTEQNTVSQWETGARNPRLPHLLRLAELLDCSIDDLLTEKIAIEKESTP